MTSTVETTPIPGLYWEENIYTTAESMAVVSDSPGPGVADLVTHESNFTYHHYGLHVGQVDRLTFFGNPEQVIRGDFVDCRARSSTALKRHTMYFNPSHVRKLIIGNGIAHTFSNIEHVVTRDEPIWLLSTNNPAYNLGNDVLNFPLEADDAAIPLVNINELPIPDFCYRFVLDYQHEAYRRETPVYGMRYKVMSDGVERYVLVKHVSEPSANFGIKSASRYPIFWSSTYFASSGGRSYYIVESLGVTRKQFVIPANTVLKPFTASILLNADAALTLIGDPNFHGTVEIYPSEGPPQRQSLQPDPLRCLIVPAGSTIRYEFNGPVLCRWESLAPGVAQTYLFAAAFGEAELVP